MAPPSTDDLDALEHYFGPALAAAEHSTFGAMLEAASNAYRTSNGRVLDVRRYRTVTRELEGSTPTAPRFAQVVTGWPTMVAKKVQGGGGVEPETRDQQLQLVARVGRRLAQLSPHLVDALAVLYGDRGCRWANEKHGRLWALVVQTKPAREALEADTLRRQRKATKATARGEEPDLSWQALRPDDRLALLAAAEPRPVWVDDALDQAEQLRDAAEAAWAATAPVGDDLEADEGEGPVDDVSRP